MQRYKAGMPTEDLLAITAAEIADPNLDVSGVMFHLGRHSADPAVWGAGVDALVEMLETLRRLWNGWTPRELDLGGGYPAPADPFGRLLAMRAEAPARAPGVADYAQAICPRLVTGLAELGIAADGIQLEVEPGRGALRRRGDSPRDRRQRQATDEPGPR